MEQKESLGMDHHLVQVGDVVALLRCSVKCQMLKIQIMNAQPDFLEDVLND
jgi:hypothetical protein